MKKMFRNQQQQLPISMLKTKVFNDKTSSSHINNKKKLMIQKTKYLELK